MEVFLILLFIIDIILIAMLLFFYFRFKKVFELPWDEIKESIERAQDLVIRLEKLQKEKGDLRKQIYMLAENGLSPKEIAKKLNLPTAEVEIILASKK